MQAGFADALPLEPGSLVSNDSDLRPPVFVERYDLNNSKLRFRLELQLKLIDDDFPKIVRAHAGVDAAQRPFIAVEEEGVRQEIVSGGIDYLHRRAGAVAQFEGA